MVLHACGKAEKVIIESDRKRPELKRKVEETLNLRGGDI